MDRERLGKLIEDNKFTAQQLTRDRFSAGLTSALDVAQAEQNLHSTEAAIPPLKQGLQIALNRLSVLLDRATCGRLCAGRKAPFLRLDARTWVE